LKPASATRMDKTQMETWEIIVSGWPIAAGLFILVLTIGRILNRLEVLESKMVEAWKAINELIRK
jgi:hypothetical protein